jgi:hypothetical protein
MRFLTSGFLHESVSLKFPAQGATSVALTPVAILPPVSTNQRYRRENLSPVLLIPVEHDLGVSPRIFEKFKMSLMLFLGAWGKIIHDKKT